MRKLLTILLLSLAFLTIPADAKKRATPKQVAKQTSKSKQRVKPSAVKKPLTPPIQQTQQNQSQSIKTLNQTLENGWQILKFWAFVVFGVIFTGMLIWFTAKYFLFNGSLSEGEYGTARFATTAELKKHGILREYKNHLVLGPGDIHVGIYKDGWTPLATTYFAALPPGIAAGHNVIIGPTKAGKTFSILLPNIVKASETEESLFITDVKKEKKFGQLFEMSSGYFANAIYFSPIEPTLNELKFNPIPEIKNDVLKASSLARAVCETGEDSHWDATAVELLIAIWFHTATMPHPNLVTGHRLLMSKLSVLRNALENSPNPETRTIARAFLDAPEKEAGSILSNTRKRCAFLNDKKIQEFCWTDAATDFTIMRREKTTIFYQARILRNSALKGLNSLIFTYMTEQLLETGGLPVKFLLDEFANCGKIPDFVSKITTFQSAGLHITAVVQSARSQLEKLYGKSDTTTILNSFNNQIALPRLNFEDAKFVSDQLGVTTVTSRSTSTVKGSLTKGSNSVSSHARQLMTPNEVSTMAKNTLLVFRSDAPHGFKVTREEYRFPQKTKLIELKPEFTIPEEEIPPRENENIDDSNGEKPPNKRSKRRKPPDWD